MATAVAAGTPLSRSGPLSECWTCSVCTLMNPTSAALCEACEAPRPPPAPASAAPPAVGRADVKRAKSGFLAVLADAATTEALLLCEEEVRRAVSRDVLGLNARGELGLATTRMDTALREALQVLLPLPASWAELGGERDDRAVQSAIMQQARPRPATAGSPPALPASLLPKLRQYQMDALRWMRAREDPAQIDAAMLQAALWTHRASVDGKRVRFSSLLGAVLVDQVPPALVPVRGGILADEMGLGKTVTSLALIMSDLQRPAMRAGERVEQQPLQDMDEERRGGVELALAPFACLCTANSVCEVRGDEPTENCQGGCGRRFHRGCYAHVLGSDVETVCVKCTSKSRRAPSASHATLIVVPHTLLHQWESEINKHVAPGALRCFVYRGVKHHSQDLAKAVDQARKRALVSSAAAASPGVAADTCFRACVTPSERAVGLRPEALARYDVVLASYEALNDDFHHIDIDPDAGSRFRNSRKYETNISALTMIQFHRVIIDESQLVHSSASQRSKVALHLNAPRRWCVSGTPMGPHMSDVHGLLAFLRHDPLDDPKLFQRASPGQIVAAFKDGLMWRNTKALVADQLDLPRLQISVHHVVLSSVEKTYYDHVLQEEIHANVQSKLQRLREAAIHASIGTHGLHHARSNNNAAAPPLPHVDAGAAAAGPAEQDKPGPATVGTVAQILDKLIDKSKTQVEDALRELLSVLNGRAALSSALGDDADALAAYEAGWALILACDARAFKPDRMQLIHCALHFARLCARDDQSARARELDARRAAAEAEFLANARLGLAAALDALGEFQPPQHPRHPPHACSARENHPREVWPPARWVASWQAVDDASVRRVAQDFPALWLEAGQTRPGLARLCQSWLGAVERARGGCLDWFWALPASPAPEQVRQSAECSVCRDYTGATGPACELCAFGQGALSEYKALLGPCAAADSPLLAIGALDADAGRRAADAAREFAAMQSAWLRRDAQLKALDELDQAKIRLEVVPSGAGPVRAWQVREFEARARLEGYKVRAVVLESEFARTRAKLEFLQEQAARPTCPVCFEELDASGSVLSCDHVLCVGCFEKWAQNKTAFTCPLCRTLSRRVARPKMASLDGFGAKIEAVVAFLLSQIPANDKVLVFSSFDRVLDLLALALTREGVGHVRIKGKHEFDERLGAFKSRADVQTLLMLFRAGGQGLNLTEARHVVLVEPLLNRAIEAQAVARVHRIGQAAREVCVHRFVAKGTVEERVLRLADESGAALDNASMDDASKVDVVDDQVVLEKLLG